MDVKKSQRAFVGVTLTTVLGIAIVLVVYAATLFSLQGGEVTVGSVGGSITYSSVNATGATWDPTLGPLSTSDDWYVRLVTDAGGYAGPATITWQLQQKDGGGTYNNLGTATQSNVILTTSSQTFYASSGGTITSNRDWSLTATSTGSYRVVVTVQSTG